MTITQPEIRIPLLSNVLVMCAHNAPATGQLRYSAYVEDATGKTTLRLFAQRQPIVVNNVLTMDNAELQLSDHATWLVEQFIAETAAYVNAPRTRRSIFRQTPVYPVNTPRMGRSAV